MDDFSLGDMLKETKKPFPKWEKKLIIGIIIGIVLIAFIVITLILTAGSKSKVTVKENLGEIYCIYEVDTVNNPVPILGNDFKKNSKIDIYVNGELIKFSKEFKFKEIGKYNIKYTLNEDISMDYMFKDISSLISIDMISEKNCEIKSMISSFENCENLIKFSISGFSTKNIKSLHKLFYKTS